MNPLIDYYDNVVTKAKWIGMPEAEVDVIVSKCAGLAKSSSTEEQEELKAHVSAMINKESK